MASAAFLPPAVLLHHCRHVSAVTTRYAPPRLRRGRVPQMTRAAAHLDAPAPPSTPPPVTKAMLAAAHKAADAAAAAILPYFRQSPSQLSLSDKPDTSPVTAADHAAEAAIRSVLRAAFPDHSILGEEDGRSVPDPTSPYVWVVDPIDGTKAFVAGRPTFATLISLTHHAVPVLGLIHQPITRERWVGALGHPTTLNGAPVRAVASAQLLNSCVVHATTPDMFAGLDALAWRALRATTKAAVFGSDCYAYAMLATGCAELVVEADLKAWDFMALVPVVQGAGGFMTDWEGRPLRLWSDGRVVAAANKQVLTEAVAVLGTVDQGRLEIGSIPTRVSEALPTPGAASTKGNGNGLPEDPGPGHVESMTGFGAAIQREGNITVGVEIRSVNSRYCDVQVRGPRYLMPFDSEISAIVKQGAVRGKLLVNLDVTVGEKGASTGAKELSVTVDIEAAKAVRKLLDQLADASGITAEPTLENVLSFSDVLVRREASNITGQVLNVAKVAVLKAVEDLRCSRRREGALLEHDLMRRTRKMHEILDEIETRAPERVEREKKHLLELTKDLVKGKLVDQNRLECEVTLFADRVDITEEVVRLRAHLSLFELTFLSADEPIGQRLTFVLQEMHRETTTIGAKAADAPIAQHVVLVKEEIEKVREQCQNIR